MATFTIKSTEAIVDDILITLVTQVPDLTDINVGSVTRTLTEALATEVNLIYQALNNVYLGTRLDSSTDGDLDNLGAIVGVTRKAGTTTTGNITFIRNAEAISDFTIAAGAVISTQPNTGDEQLRYDVTTNTTFSASITGETHTFTDGVTDYPMNERLISTSTPVAITGTVLTLPHTFVQTTDFQIVQGATATRVDETSIITFDNMDTALTTGGWFGDEATLDAIDATTGWAATSEGSVSTTSTPGNMKYGTAALTLLKASGVAATVTYDRTLGTAADYTNKYVFIWYYITNTSSLAAAGTAVRFKFGTNSSNYWYKDYTAAQLVNGWNLLSFSSSTATGTTGVPTLTACVYEAVTITYFNATTVVSGTNQRIDWLRTAYIPIVDAADYRKTPQSLRFTKLGITSTSIAWYKTEAAVTNSQGQKLAFWMKIKDATALAKILQLSVTIASGGNTTNSFTQTFQNSDLSVGWNLYLVDQFGSSTTRTGNVNNAALNYMKVELQTNTISQTLTTDDWKMDWVFFDNVTTYYGDLIRWIPVTGTLPDDTTTFSVNYKPLSKEVPCNAEAVGVKYNVGRNKVIFKVSVIANIDNVNNYDALTGGTDIESDDDYRTRISFATEAAGKATVEALRQAVLAVNGITAVTVTDLPPYTATLEVHQYVNTTQDYALNFEIAQDDLTLAVTGTAGGPYTFIKGTDYILIDNKIRFQIGGTNPDNLTNFFTTYNYNWLGHVQIFVTGTTTPLPTAIATAVSDAIYATKAAGIDVTWSEPTTITVDVTALVSANTAGGYTFAQIQPNVENAIYQYLNSLGPGEDVYRAALFQVIQNVTGVLNSSITFPAADVAITSAQVARPGTISIGSL